MVAAWAEVCVRGAERPPVLSLVAKASEEALAAAAVRPSEVDRVSVLGILAGGGPRPASDLAERLGLRARRCETTTIGGNGPQWLVTRVAAEIAAGRLRSTLIAGGEALAGAGAGASGGQDGQPSASTGGDPDPLVGDPRPGVGPAEIAIGLGLPLHVYAILESAYAARLGRRPAAHRAALGELLAPFSEVAARHPYAWSRTPLAAREIALPGPDNRLVCEQYTKRMCANPRVNQAAALLVCSLAEARRLGLAEQAVFVWAGADATDVWEASARPELWRSPGIELAAGATLNAAGVQLEEVAYRDLYSCFPVAVELALDALAALSDGRGVDAVPPTVTGALPFFGGPGNNYSTHAIATVCRLLSGAEGRQLALVGALGWYLTKHSYGLYGSSPPPGGFVRADTSVEQRRIDASALPVVREPEPLAERARVEGWTVVRAPDGTAERAPVIARLNDGRRVVCEATDEQLSAFAGDEVDLTGATLEVRGWPPRYRLVRA